MAQTLSIDAVARLAQGRVVAIIRGMETDTCLRLAEAYLAGGIRVVEVTFDQKHPENRYKTTDAISAISRRFGSEMLVGAGTVLTEEQLAAAHDAGARFVVAPNVNPKIIAACKLYAMASMPGALTPTEAVLAWESGADFVKIFPAGTMGPKYFKDLKAPLSHIPMLAVGGITPDNAADFMRAGAVGVAVSGALVNRALIGAGDWKGIESVARALIEATAPCAK